jgi:hypothetical protein
MIFLFFSVLVIAIVAFCAGMIVPVLGMKSLQFVQYIRRRGGYIASFGAGAVLMGAFSVVAQPYTVARWAGLYDDAILGSLITSDQKILQTGQIPQDVLDWYASKH